MNARKLMALAVICVAAASPSLAGLVARWDFNNYDPSNPTSAAILAPTVGTLAAIPCTGTTASTEVTDGTLGSITVVNTGLPEGDYALSIPNGAHLKVPLPSGIVRDKSWSMRIRFYYPGTANTLNTLVSGEYTGVGNGIWFVSGKNLIQGSEGLFGTSVEENQNTVGTAGKQKSNGWNAFRLVSRNAWHSFTAHYGPDGTSSTLDGYRCVSLADKSDIRTQFTGDGFVLCASTYSATTYISSVEVWEDTPVYRDTNSGAYIPTASRTVFDGCSLEALRDMYISVKGLGAWGEYARTMSSWEHIVTTDGEGNVTDLKIDLRGKDAADAILCDFTASSDDVAGQTLRDQWSLGWPSPYFTTSGGFASTASYQAAPASYNANGYSAYNIYALPFRPLDDSLNWSMQMGSGKFGNPIFSIVGDNPTLTFNAAPQADSITLDCGRGDGKAGVTFAYGSAALKTMSGLGGLNIGSGVTLTTPTGVTVAGPVAFELSGKLALDLTGVTLTAGDVLFTATGGITFPAGKTVTDCVIFPRGVPELSQDGTQILFTPDPSIVFTATWLGDGDRNNVSDPLNWECRNYSGTVLDGRIPDANTAITVSGTTTFNVPLGQTLTYFSLAIANSALAMDCDWRGLGTTVSFASNASVNLDGHNLTVAGLESPNNGTIRNDNSGTRSTLCVSNVTETANTKVAIAGNVKFVKMGTGGFTAGKGCTYTGGNELLEGVTYVSLNATQQATMGASGNEILVRNATLDLGGQVWYTIYGIVLDNGTISSAFSENITTYGGGAIIGDMTLLSNSTFLTTGSGNLRLWSGRLLDLGGNTLSVNLANATKFIVGTDVDGATSVATISNGTFVVSGGTFMTQNYKGTINAMTTTMRMGCAINLPSVSTMNVRDYEALYAGTDNSGTGALNVYGTFTPVESGFYGCTMQNGSTINLSGKTGTWSSTSTSGAAAVKFAENAEVTIDLSGRDDLKTLRRNKEYVVTWDTPPSGTVKFKLDAETRTTFRGLSRSEGGLRLSSTGVTVLVR